MTQFQTTIAEVLRPTDEAGRAVLAALQNNQVVSLATPCRAHDPLVPLTRAHSLGFEVHRNTLLFLLAQCAAQHFPSAVFRARLSLDPALLCTLEGTSKTPAEIVAVLRPALEELVQKNLPITVEALAYKEAVELFSHQGRVDEINLLKHRNPPAVLLSHCGDFFALNQGALAPRTGCVAHFDLIPTQGAFVLNLPTAAQPDQCAPLPPFSSALEVLRKQLRRSEITRVRTVGDLNQAILENHFDVLVRTVEALQTKELAQIADQIASRTPAVRLVLLAGPSSAGKTTTAHRLCTQLRVNALKPLLLSTDDYFVGDARNPRDAEGNLDYEHVDAVDSTRLAHDLNRLFAGRPVHLRKFNFPLHEGFDAPTETRLPANGIVVLEGIHALNPHLTRDIDENVKFRLYINALTQLVLDSCNRVSVSDIRLLRRLVRDFNFRNMNPKETFRLWPGVLAGEKKWIDPFRGTADAVFNSTLDYELAVLKPYAAALLNQVKPWDETYVQARRLSGFLHNVSLARPDAVPGDSILRETIGGSQLDY